MPRIVTLAFFFTLGMMALGAHGAIEPPPPAPEGWQQEVTPGFDPSIESVIVSARQRFPFEKVSFAEQLHTRGPEAIPALIRLYENPKWAQLKYVMIGMLAQSDAPEAQAYLLSRFEALAKSAEPSEEQRVEMANLCRRLAEYHAQAFRDRLFKEAQEGNTAYASELAPALCKIGTGAALAAMKALQARLPRDERDIVDLCISSLDGHLMAQEPMGAPAPYEVKPAHRRNSDLRRQLRDARLSEYDTGKLVNELVAAEGDTAVRFLARLASNPKACLNTRRQAIVGLGQIGTKKAVKAFAKLRDAAFAKHGAPEPKDHYTHAEKMIEASVMTVYTIPDVPPNLCGAVDTWTWDTTGQVNWQGRFAHLKRYGEEWLVIDTGEPPAP